MILSIMAFLAISCSSPSQDMEMLQKKFKTTTVYKIVDGRYIIADSINVYDVRLTPEGQMYSTIKIK